MPGGDDRRQRDREVADAGLSAEKPSTCCMYSDSRKNIPKIIVPRPKPMMFAPVSVRRLKIAERHERRARARLDPEEDGHQHGRGDQRRRSSAPTPSRRWFACVSPKTSSIRLAGDGDGAERVEVARHALRPALAHVARDEGERDRAAIGTLTKKIHSQPTYSVRTPPRSTPIAAPEPAIAPRMPSALFRSAPSAKVTSVIEKTDGERIAPAAPCSEPRDDQHRGRGARGPRAARSRAKSARPTMKRLRRPSRSPMRPPSSRKPPNVSA